MLTHRSPHPALRAGLVLCALAALLLALAAPSGAAPVTVQLRVEGSSTTLYEGPVATEPQTFETASSKGAHPCNYAENGGSESEFANGGTPSATPTDALRSAALAGGLAFDAEWFGNEKNGGNPGDFFVLQVGPDANSKTAFWGYAVDETTAPVGGCQVALPPGAEVLWAYNYFGLAHHLHLAGPATVSAGVPFTVHVVDGQNGQPVAGASIGTYGSGVTTPLATSTTTDAAGNATVTLASAGTVALKATQPESVRSNAISICVHNGNDGTCGTTILPIPCPLAAGPGSPTCPGPCAAGASAIACRPPVAPIDTVTAGGVRQGRTYHRRSAPRVLTGAVQVPAGGTLRDVRISLLRRVGRHCYAFSGTRVRFVRARCGSAHFFSVGGSQSFSYLLPSRLPRGRYVYEVEALEAGGRASRLVQGVSEVSFRVA
jgi:hypothetical protein